MKKIGIISDTHGYLDVIDEIVAYMQDEEIDMWFHAGDYGDDARYMQTLVTVPVIAVRGNNDRQHPLEPMEQLIPLEDTYVYMTHGHRIASYGRSKEMLFMARSMGAKLAISGHSHHHGIETTEDGYTWVNPGSPSLPRDGSGGTIAVATYEQGHFEVEFINVSKF